MIGINIHFLSYLGSYSLGISCQHHNFIHTITAHLIQSLFHQRTNWILDADDTHKVAIAGYIDIAHGQILQQELLHAGNAAFRHKLGTAYQHLSSLIILKGRYSSTHATSHHGFGGFVLRHSPLMLLHIFVNSYRQRMDRMLFCRSSQKQHFLFFHIIGGINFGNLRHAYSNGTSFVQNHSIGFCQGLNIVATLNQNTLLGSGANGSRNCGSCRQLQATGEINKEKIQHPLPISSGTINNGSSQEGNRHQQIGHTIRKILYRSSTSLSFLYQMHNMGQGSVLTYLFY